VERVALSVPAVPAHLTTSISCVAWSVTADRVDSSEARGGECDEQLWVTSHRTGDPVVSAVEAGVDELPDVACIQIRAGRARCRAAVVAPGQNVMQSAELVGCRETDRAGTESRSFRLFPPCLEVRRCGSPNHLFHHVGVIDRGRDSEKRRDNWNRVTHCSALP
jgi:hypothetical protein